MPLLLDFDLDFDEYRRRYACVAAPNLLQDAVYGRAMGRAQGVPPRWGLLRDGNDELAVVQVLERHALAGLLGAVVLDRGPLWLPGVDDMAHAPAFFRAFDRRWPRRPGRRRRILPELPHGDETSALLHAAGCRAAGDLPYATYIVSVDDAAECRRRLLPRWRQVLDHAHAAIEDDRLRLAWPQPLARLPDLLRRHLAHREAVGYRGPAQAELNRLLLDYAKAGSLLIGEARAGDSEQPCALIALLCHGRGATYQIAWNSEAGRRLGANNALLWSALERLRERGITHLDLGGHSALHTPGLMRYKAGLGGYERILAGMHD